MDSSRYKRRPRQTRRQQPKIDFEPSVPALKSSSALPKPKHHWPALDMGLPSPESPIRPKKTLVYKSKWRAIRRRVLKTSAVMTVLSIALVGFLFSQGYLKLNKVFNGNATSVASLTSEVDPDKLKGEGDGRVNVLLLGRGGGTHEAPDLTDTIILASIDPVNHTASLLSIPRDLWVNVPSQGAMKINAAWEMGEFKYLGRIEPGSNDPLAIQAGFSMVDQVVEEVLGVPIHYNVLLDFKAFQQAIDTVNGVTVNVPTDLFDPTMAWENGRNPVLATAGTQTFGGKKALIYVRSRETTSDFARSQRQRTVMVALKDKVDNLGTLSNPIKISGLLGAFGNNVQTDLSLKDASRMYSILKQINDKKVSSIGLAEGNNRYITTGAIAGQSVAYPMAGLFDYTAIQGFVRAQLPDGYILKEKAKIMVLNGTTAEGASTAKVDELKSYGYNVVAVGKSPTSNYKKTQLISLSSAKDRYKYTTNYLQRRLHVTVKTSLPDKSIQPNGANFVIIVGSDETNSP